MKVKTSELTNRALNYLVAKVEGHESRCHWMLEKEGWASWQSYERAWGNPIPAYTTDWAVAGPIIDREIIELMAMFNPDYFQARVCKKTGWVPGKTMLIAYMRAYVISKLGDEVDVPEELV